MNKEWSQLNKEFQNSLKKATFSMGVNNLLLLRETLFSKICILKNLIKAEDYGLMPFINSKGYHSKSIAYSLWHIFRIEDIVCNSLINHTDEILFKNNYIRRINSSIITTGNELVKEQIKYFSLQLNIDELYNYIVDVKETTNKLINTLTFNDLKTRFTVNDKNYLKSLNVVDKSQEWLIDYWCGKDIKGLLLMPFSRHWIMHVEAIFRILDKIHIS